MRKILSLGLSYDTYVRDISIVFLLLLPLTISNAISIFFGYFLNFTHFPELAQKFFYFSNLLIAIYPTALCLITTYYLSSKNNISAMVVMPYALVMYMAISMSNDLTSVEIGLPNNPLLALCIAAFSAAYCYPFGFHPLDPSRIDFVSSLYKQALHLFSFLLITAVFIWMTSFFIEKTSEFKSELVIDPLTLGGGLLYQFILGLLGSVGINGHNFLFISKQRIFEKTQENIALWENGEATLNILGQGFYDAFLSIGGSGNSLSLLLCILIFSREKRHIIFALSALPLIMFNINELLLFGLPIVFNPTLILPFIFVPLVSFLLVYFAIYFEFVNPIGTIVDWMTPPLISGYLATQNSIGGVVLQLIVIAVGTLIYKPFYRHYTGQSSSKNKIIFQQYEIDKTTLKTFLGDVNQSMDEQLNKHLIGQRVNKMLTRGHFVMYYQPQVHLINKEKVSFESLVRYIDENGQMSMPTFIQDFFKLGAMKQLDKIVIDLVLSDMQSLPFDSNCKVGVNISPESISDPLFVDHIVRRLKHYKVPPRSLEIEITEEAILEDHLQISRNIQFLQIIGVKVAIDDFGSGYASFSHLLKFNFDKVKLDRSLLLNTQEERGQKLYLLLAKISEVTGCALVAEGIETEQEKDFIKRCGIDICQGFYFSKPMPLDESILWLKRHKRRDLKSYSRIEIVH